MVSILKLPILTRAKTAKRFSLEDVAREDIEVTSNVESGTAR